MTDGRLEVVVDGRGAVQGSNVTVRALRNVEGQAGRVHGAFDRMQRSIFSLRGALTGLAGAFAFRELTQAIDSWNLYEARLRLVTDSAEELTLVQERLFDSAQDTRTAFGATVTLYSRIANATRDLDLAQTDLIARTTTVNQAIQIGGATAQEAAAGVTQFSQALASGELRGDEFRSISENLIGLRDALVDGLNEMGEFGVVTVGTLREMAQNGELTTEVLLRALEAVEDQTQATFDRLPRTIGQAIQQLENDFFRLIGTTDETTEAGERFAEAIDRVREVINSPDFAAGISIVVEGLALMAENMDAVVVVGTTLIGLRLGAAFGPWGAGIGAVTGALAGLIINQRTANSLGAESDSIARGLAEAYELMAIGANEAAAAELRLIGAQGQRGIASLRVDIQGEQERIEDLRRQYDEFGEAFDDGTISLAMELTSEEIVAANQNIVAMEGQISDLHGQMAEAAREANNLAAGLDSVVTPTSNVGELTEDLTSRYTDFVATGNDVFAMQREINAVMAEYSDIQGQLAEAQSEAFFAGDTERARELAQQMEQLRLSQAAQIQQIEERYTPAVVAATGATDAFSESMGRVKGKGEEAEEAVKKVAEGADEVSQEWQQLGGVFSSALEGAIINGEGFRDVLSGIAEDLARLAFQQATLAAFGGGGGGNLFGDLIRGIGSIFGLGPTPKVGVKHAGGRGADFQSFTRTSLSGDERLTVVRNNERVLTLGQQQRMGGRPSLVINQNFHISPDVANDSARLTENLQRAAADAEAGMRATFDRWLADELSFGGALNQVA